MRTSRTDSPASTRLSRRQFLGTLGAGAVAVGARATLGVPAAEAAPIVLPDKFGRIFRNTTAFAANTPEVQAALLELGAPGGLLDAADDLAAGPGRLGSDPTLSVNNPDNPTMTAGFTFFGQFMDHDMTFDIGSPLGVTTDPATTTNSRTPAFDLDSVYGGGPVGSPQLFDSADTATFKVENGGLFEDLPRAADSSAIIADPRNDENIMLAGIHCAVLKFHNNAVAHARGQGVPESDVFAEAQRLTRWHYQWVILHQILPRFVGQATIDSVLTGGRLFYRTRTAFMPVEFQTAAYRFGHSMVRPSYRANLAGDNGSAFVGFIFDPTQDGSADPEDLRGGVRAPRRFIGWQSFFDFGDGQVRQNKLVDTNISTPLFNLPLFAIPGGGTPTSLAQRNLLRHLTFSLPSGQTIARKMRTTALTTTDLQELAAFGQGFDRSTPLWYYVLKEAELQQGGLQLGAVGGRIVAEVIIGLLQLDSSAFLSAQPTWTPELPSTTPGDFLMQDFLRFAGVDPVTRGQ